MRPTYLITGSLGSLGREIVPRILCREPSARIALLARAGDDAALRHRMEELGRYLDAYWPHVDRSRLLAIRGDVTEFHLGLAEGVYRELTARVTHVIHAAACIDLSQPLGAARRVHVDGAREVLRFAERCPRLIHLGHVSTAFVAGDRRGTILERNLRCGQGFRNAYEQSKCEAEEIVQARMEELPITVFRPSIIVGDARDGRTCNFATLYRPLRMISKGWLRRVPADPDSRLDIVTVDYVADVLSELMIVPRRRSAVYHLVAGPERSIRVADLVDAARSCAGTQAPRARDESHRAGLAIFFSYLERGQVFDDAAVRADLGANGPRPAGPEAYLPRILAFCTATDWGRSLPWEERQWRPAA